MVHICDLSWAVLLMVLEAAVGQPKGGDRVGQGALPGSLKPPWENLEWRFCCPRGKLGVWHT